jgi:hypothetical protein
MELEVKLEIVRKPPHTASNFRDSVEKFHEDVVRMQKALSWFQTELTLLQHRLIALLESPRRRNGR